MKVERLKELGYHKIYQAVLDNHLEQEITRELNDYTIISTAFTWEESVQGRYFWLLVHEGRFEEALELRPEMAEDSAYSIIPGGLMG